MTTNRRMLVVLGNQLFPIETLPVQQHDSIFMCEDYELCSYVRHHKHKLLLVLSAMRSYRDELRSRGHTVHYEPLGSGEGTFEDQLHASMQEEECSELVQFEIEGNLTARRLAAFADRYDLKRRVEPSPMFLCDRDAFAEFVAEAKTPKMAEFYKLQRRRLDVLMTKDKPSGGKWSFDADNRRKLPRSLEPPEIAPVEATDHVADVAELINAQFADHPGDTTTFWWPTTREQALTWLDDFVGSRLEKFGDYEDAMTTRSATVFHSALSPLLNIGLITPQEVIDRVLAAAESRNIPLNSLEGFIRQIIGWREFVRGIYHHYDAQMRRANFWNHRRKLTDAWYQGSTGIPPLDDTITTAQRLGWTHHIPRLMVAGNLMTLAEIHPREAYRWFMEMYADSSAWVMGPNVFGMALFSDGGLFTTKPYICGSNYLLRMSDYAKGDWCDVVDGLYWRFIGEHLGFFEVNPRLAMVTRAFERLGGDRKSRIFAAAETFLDECTA